jgi:hypothetical protein
MAGPTRTRLEALFAPHEERLRQLIGWCPSERGRVPNRRAA